MLSVIALSVVIVAGGVQPAQDIARLSSALSSSNPAVRETALLELRQLVGADAELGESTELPEALGLFLEAELTALRSGAAEQDNRLGDRYQLVAPLVLRALDRSVPLPPAFLRAAVRSSYLLGGDHSRTFARFGPPIVPYLVEMTASSVSARQAGYKMLGKMVQEGRAGSLRSPLSPATEVTVKQHIRSGLQDADPWARKAAIQAVVDADDLEAIPILTQMAATDPDGGRFPVRVKAAEALTRLKR
jgi:hypothetical protein